jgi:hypothetical protein
VVVTLVPSRGTAVHDQRQKCFVSVLLDSELRCSWVRDRKFLIRNVELQAWQTPVHHANRSCELVPTYRVRVRVVQLL